MKKNAFNTLSTCGYLFLMKTNSSWTKKTWLSTIAYLSFSTFFCQNPKIVFSRDELINEVWNGSILTDQVITQAIFELRKILKAAERHSMGHIITVPKRGYKLDVDVHKTILVPASITTNTVSVADIEHASNSFDTSPSIQTNAPDTSPVFGEDKNKSKQKQNRLRVRVWATVNKAQRPKPHSKNLKRVQSNPPQNNLLRKSLLIQNLAIRTKVLRAMSIQVIPIRVQFNPFNSHL